MRKQIIITMAVEKPRCTRRPSGGNKEVVELLISKGADVNAKDASSRTLLQFTERISDPKVRQEIIALLQGQMAKQSNPRQLLNSLLDRSKGHSDNDELRKSIIQAALSCNPLPPSHKKRKMQPDVLHIFSRLPSLMTIFSTRPRNI